MSRSKNPLDSLQSMVNGILIETGRALRGSDKEGGRTFANANTRLRSTIPSAIENFHQALDDLESDIVRAKAVLLRDLEELQSKRFALENPPIQVAAEPIREPSVEVESPTKNGQVGNNQLTPQPFIKEEKPDVSEAAPTPKDPAKETITKIPDLPKDTQNPSPPSSNDTNIKPESSNLGINTTAAPTDVSPPLATAELQDSIDSLFDGLDSGNNTTSDLNFDGINFLNDSTTQDTSQAQNNEFDLSNFGNSPQDFNMTDIQDSTGNLNNNNSTNDIEDDLFGMVNNEGGDDMMDLDGNNPPADENSFNDLYFMGDDGGMGGETEMEHGEFDDVFFGLA